jgi:hypothetical protein
MTICVIGTVKMHPVSLRQRWFSGRAFALHLAVVAVAGGCALAAWWQATRALGGNGLSWVYAVEWPAFAVIAIVAWWHLIHEDPEVRRARKSPTSNGEDPAVGPHRVIQDQAAAPGSNLDVKVEPAVAHIATILAILVACEFVLGIMTLVVVPVGRPSGGIPTKGRAIFLTHAVVGALLIAAGGTLVVWFSRTTRLSRIVAWMGLSGLALAGLGGLLTAAQSLTRFLGLALMLVGALVSGFAYLIPRLVSSSREASRAAAP